ncbi:MAG: hypothetical protein GQ574_00080 [Crocinitomix sp.]|nr:hypothetical protein [Crocinitomix sp.]
MNNTYITSFDYQVPIDKIPIAELRQVFIDDFSDHVDDLESPKFQNITLDEIEAVSVYQNYNPGTEVISVIEKVLTDKSDGRELDLIIDYSVVSKLENGLSIGNKIQEQLNARNALVLSVGNGGCLSFMLALKTAQAFMQANDQYKNVLLFSEDHVIGNRYNPGLNVLGDGASAILLQSETDSTMQLVDVECYNMGRLNPVLGVRHDLKGNFKYKEFENKIQPLHYKVIYDLFNKVLRNNSLKIEDIDLVLYQNMSHNDYVGLKSALQLSEDQLHYGKMKGHGHVFGSDIIINMCHSTEQGKLEKAKNIVAISSGAGFSWAVSLIKN